MDLATQVERDKFQEALSRGEKGVGSFYAFAAALARLRMPPSSSPLDIHNLMGAPDPASWRAIREYRYVMPAVQSGAGSGWAAEYLGHPTKPCSACAEMDGWGCREHQIKI